MCTTGGQEQKEMRKWRHQLLWLVVYYDFKLAFFTESPSDETRLKKRYGEECSPTSENSRCSKWTLLTLTLIL